jgi:segregation and condensation protein B
MSNEEVIVEQQVAEESQESAIEPVVVGDEQMTASDQDASAETVLLQDAPVEPAEGEGDNVQVNFADDEIKPLIESLLFAHGDPLSSKRLSEISKVDETVIDDILHELLEESKSPVRGVELVRIAEKYQYRTKSRFAPAIRELKAGRPKRLSGAALETLAVIAYRQPVVKSDIEKIRGVDVAPTLKTLLERSLVKIIGHQPTVGQPALYGTTDEFLKIFSLNSLSELPSLRDVAEFDFEPGESEEEITTEEPQLLSQ